MDATSNHDATILKVGACRRRWPKAVLYGVVCGLLAALIGHYGLLLLTHNFHTVVPGRFYRCAQLSEADLRRTVQRHGIRTIVNLRGICFGENFYLDECRTAHECNVSLEDIGLSAGRIPPVGEIRQLVRALDHSEQPILIHCRQGVDRTGLASAIVLLLYTDADLPTARRQLGLRYGHVALGRTAYLSRFFDLYADWLAAQHCPHSRQRFRRWIEHEYCPGMDRARLEVVDVPAQVPVNRPWTVRVRAHNTSVQTWRLRPEGIAGIHCGYLLADENGQSIQRGRAGMFIAEVAAGGSIELTLALVAVQRPGTYYLMVDMLDEQQQSWFYQHGSEPLLREVVVGP